MVAWDYCVLVVYWSTPFPMCPELHSFVKSEIFSVMNVALITGR